MVGQPDIYLHLRFQDAPAGQLYRKAGFTAAKEDLWLVLLLGMDRRYLMHKRLQPSATRSRASVSGASSAPLS